MHLLKNEPGQNASANYKNLNDFLDVLQNNEEARSAFANQIQTLNAACFNRSAAGINTILREIRKNYPDDLPIKNFMPRAILDVTLKEADAELAQTLENKFKSKKEEALAKMNEALEQGDQVSATRYKNLAESYGPVAESYQAVYGDVVRMLRKKIPALPSQFEDVYQNYGRYSLLTDSERKTICKNVINKITNPMECARLLQNSGVENAWMEKRYAGELSHLRAPLNNETRYAEFAKDKVINEKILSMGGIVDDEFVKKMKEKTLSQDEIAEILSTDEMMKIDMPLHEEADKAIQIFYAGIIQASTGLGSSA